MSVDTKRLRELAEKATPGPWAHADAIAPRIYLYSNPAPKIDEPWERVMLGETYADGAGQGRRNLAFIAAASPSAVLQLLDALDAMTKARNEALGLVDAALKAKWDSDKNLIRKQAEILRKVGQ